MATGKEGKYRCDGCSVLQASRGVRGSGEEGAISKQCGKVAESIRINEAACEEALNFFNHLNMLFPDILADLVFIDPQITLDKVAELVEESYIPHEPIREEAATLPYPG